MVKHGKECNVCQKINSSYKCPKCLVPYCSLGCWGVHKQACSGAVQTTSTHGTTLSQEEDAAEKAEIVTVGTGSRNNGESRVEDDDELLLRPEQKERLRSSEKLKSLLKSKRLRDDISCIDSAADRQAALKAMLAKNAEFDVFVDTLLTTLNG